MTTPDHNPPSRPPLDDSPLDDDMLAVHAVVDGEATADQRRRVARDPELVAQVAALRAVVDAVAQPVAPPPGEVLAAIRARALDAAAPALDASAPADEDVPAAPGGAPAVPPSPGDLAAARTRKARRLPPLPAVAAVVVLLVLVGVTLLVTATDGDSDGSGADLSAAETSGGAEEDSTAGRDEADAAEEGSGGGQGEVEDAPSTTGPAGATTDALLGQATASFPAMADLEAAVRTVDPETLRFPADTGPDGPATAPSPADDELAARAFASNPAATRCDTVLRAGEPDLEPAVAAAIVDLDGTPVLVLTTPVPVSAAAPTGFRLTLLNALDCSPRGAVLR